MAELDEGAMAKGEGVDHDIYLRRVQLLVSLSRRLGLKRVPKDLGPAEIASPHAQAVPSK